MSALIKLSSIDNIFFTSDHHFGHENIIKFCNRPFGDINEMDNIFIENWNKVVSSKDIVFHLGDFTLGDRKQAEKYFRQLNGKIFILGNEWHHDKRWLPTGPFIFGESSYFSNLKNNTGGSSVEILPPMVVLESQELSRNDNNYPLAIVLSHYPIAEWDRKHYGSWHLHGHSHGNYHYQNGEYAIDVGVDCTNYYPIKLTDVLELMHGMGWA